MEINFALRLPRDASTVPLVRAMCRDAMVRLGVSRDCQGDVALAVTEACANVVIHAAGGTEDYEVRIEFTGEWCHIRVVDTGGGIDLATLDDVSMPVAGSQEDGRGLALMRLLVDRISFESRPEDGTVVHLQKRLDLEDNSPLKVLAIPPRLS
jgi:serine/threonine-protein kinase RsbW